MPRVRKNYAERWQRKAGQSSQDYSAGILDPRSDWADSTVKSAQAYKQGLQASMAQDRWQKGVVRSGTERWQERAGKVGPGRFTEGVGLASQDYIEGVSPYLQTIERLQLPVRFAKGDPRNIQRVAAIAAALHEQKVGPAVETRGPGAR